MSEATPPVVPADDAAAASSAPVVETPVSDAPQVETTAESTAAPADPDSETAGEEAAPQRRNRAQERIEELAQTNKYLREHNEFLRDALSRGLKPAEAPQAPAPAAPVVEAPAEMPTLESCGYDVNKHAEELAKWTKAEIKRGVSEGLAQRDAAAVAQSTTQTIQQAANEFRKDHPDFDVLLANPALQFTPTVLGALEAAGAESPALGYHLAQNPDKLAKIARMSPQQQLMAMGRLQAELGAKPPTPKPTPTPPKTPAPAPAAKTPPAPKTTNAPPPPTPVGSNASPDIDPMTLSGTEWAKWRRQQLAEKREREGKAKAPPVVRRNF